MRGALSVKAMRCAVWIWYRGDFFSGFQSQPHARTVQEILARALAALGAPPSVTPSGRTDRGVHARMQVVRVRLPAGTSLAALMEEIDRLAPGALGAVAANAAHPSFHPQWSATRKEYRYRLAIGRPPPERWRPFVWRVQEHPRFAGAELDASKMADLVRGFAGARDFSAFHERSSARRSRVLEDVSMREKGEGIFELRFVGQGFARYQVRYLVGAAALVAAGIVREEDLRAALTEGTRFHGLRAPAPALVLWEVAYAPPLDPFSIEVRAQANGIPREPPFAA